MTNEPSAESLPSVSTRPSLQRRILIWQTTLLVVVVGAFGGAIYLQQRHARMRDIDGDLTAAVEVLRTRLQAMAESGPLTADILQRQTWDVPETFGQRRLRHAYEQPYLAIWDGDQRLILSTAPTLLPPLSSTESATDRRVRGRDDYREAWGGGPGGSVVLVGRHVGADFRDLRELAVLLIAAGGLVLLAGIGGAWWLSRKAVEPIAQISQVAARLSERSLDERIDASAMDVEFERLAASLNDALQRLEAAFAQQVQFTADASHELRTPLSVIRMHQDLALSKDRTPAEYRQALETCGRSTARMSELVEGLLELARLDSLQAGLRRTPTDLSLLIRDVVDDSHVLATQRSVTLHTADPETGSPSAMGLVSVDRGRMGQVLLNLLSNAIAFSPPQGRVYVDLEYDGPQQQVRIWVQDEGPGIAEAHRERVFERFYRVDSERTRQEGGSGLGLSICRAIVEAHGGRISVENVSDENVSRKTGSRFIVCLPVG